MTTVLQKNAVAARVARRVEEDLGPQKYAMWFDRPARFDFDHDQNALRVSVPNRFAADWIGKHFRETLDSATRDIVGEDVALKICVGTAPGTGAENTPNNSPGAIPRPSSTIAPGTPPGTALRPTPEPAGRPAGAPTYPARPRQAEPSAAGRTTRTGHYRHRLERFICGPSNQLALAAAKRIADLGDPTAGHPLFLHGCCGVGKTHLLQGICHAAQQLRPDAKVVYLTGEQFTNQYITAVRQGKLDTFRRRIRRLDLLAIDDVQFLASKEKTQQEFLHCFEENDLAGARVLLASDSHPRQITAFSDALVSRCVRGLVVELAEPDPVTRKTIIAELARRRGLFLQPAVIDQLAERYDGSVREIEGALAKLHALSTLTDPPKRKTPNALTPVGRALLEQLPELSQPRVRKPVKFATICQTVCDRLLLETIQLAGSSRNKQVVLARSLVVHLARQLTPMSYPEIAKAMGRKTHSTVITACQRMSRMLENDAPLLLPGSAGQTTPSALTASLTRELIRGS